jgi:hypothetical protein
MKTSNGKKDFDCVELKREAQARIYERIKNLSPEEEIEYFRKAAEEGPLGAHWKAILHRRGQHVGGVTILDASTRGAGQETP